MENGSGGPMRKKRDREEVKGEKKEDSGVSSCEREGRI